MAQDFRNITQASPRTDATSLVVKQKDTGLLAIPTIALTQNRVMRNTYLLLAISMLPALMGAFVGKNYFPMSLLIASPILSFAVFVGVFYGLIFAIGKFNNSGIGIVLLEIFTFMLGFMTGPLLIMAGSYSNGADLVGLAFGGTAVIFFAMAAIGSTLKKPLTGLGNFLAVGAIVLMVGIVASLFLTIPALSLALTCGILLFSSLAMLWRINMAYHDGHTNYIDLTLGLVIDIYNVFTTLLRLLLILSGRRD